MAYFDMSWSDLEDLFLVVPWEPRPHAYKCESGLINEPLKQLTEGLRVPQVVRSAQGVAVPGEETLLVTATLAPLFGRNSSTISSIVSQVMAHIDRVLGHLLDDLTTHTWLTLDDLNVFCQGSAVHNRGPPLSNCWGFVDGTSRPICHPSVDQRTYFSGHKRVRALKYQAVMGANGIVRELDGPYPGSRHDAGILRESGLNSKLQRLTHGCLYCNDGDPAYPLRPLLMRPYEGAALTEQQQLLNEGMSAVRQAVQWGF
ncbi:hypothetical protein HPB52_007844 [Rhipicephalus sanguineus]|uniref:DDE Tnp4 domain-containing protein n=1 Tax=Rhipicephalus sanguineus TaxID=34632 RepID=A0A9D4Q9D7_RHISA|nr:hypothetical protein HPB52_007844 [Rhipicephalus sanguineus]